MKSLEQFVKDNEGQFLEVAGSANAKFQCTDCVNGYIRDVLGFPVIEWTNAIDFKNKSNGNYEVIYNDINNPSLVPDVGDIVVYKHPNNIGHIGFCIKKGTGSVFGIFEQNWPVGSPCKSVLNKKYVIGDYIVDYWMRPKSSIIEEDMTDEQKKLLGLINDNGLSEGDLRWLVDLKKNQTVPNLEKKVSGLESKMSEIKIQLDELTEKYNNNEKEMKVQQKALTTANQTIENISAELETANKEKTNYKSWYEAKCKELKELSNKTTLLTNIIDFIKSLFKK
jgi:exonuclease VII small subunit